MTEPFKVTTKDSLLVPNIPMQYTAFSGVKVILFPENNFDFFCCSKHRLCAHVKYRKTEGQAVPT